MRRLVPLAALSVLIAAPALAAPQSGPATATSTATSNGPVKAGTISALTPNQAVKPAPTPVKATAAERAEADRLEPLARAAFWARQVDIDPKDGEAELKLARALRELGRFEEAAAAADQLLVFEPSNYEALLESARARIGGNEGFYALDDAQKAAAMQPRDWRPESLLAVALEQAHRDDEALAAHQKALALAPENPATLSNLGMYYATHGQSAQAEPLLRKAVSEPGATAQERQNLALVLGLQGRYAEAEQLQRQDLPPDQVDNNLAYLHADNGETPSRSWDAVKAAAQ